MTDLRALAYGILIALIFAFIFASFRKWRLYRVSVIIITIAIVSLGFLTYAGRISTVKGGEVISWVAWGWIFLVIGVVLLIMSYKKSEVSSDEDAPFSDAIDTVIGMVWGFALACIAGILILSSLSYFSREQNHEILTRIYTSGEIRVLSGGIRTLTASTLFPTFSYDRWSDSMLRSTPTSSGSIWTLTKEGQTSTGILKAGLTPLLLGQAIYGIDTNGYAYSGGKLLLGSRISEGSKAIIYKNEWVIQVIHKDGKNTLNYKWILMSPLILSEDTSTLVWTEGQAGSKQIKRNGESLGETYTKIDRIDISKSGQSIMALVESGSSMILVKNGIPLGALSEGTLSGSYKSNGAHSLFITEKDWIKKVVHDMEVVSRDLSVVRETFLEEEGGSYAYFARPIGEERYCLFTRYQRNLCGLEWYMNPVLWADWGSIIFAGKKDGIWNIYRNTDIIVANTGYSPKWTIDYDYAFFDTTNPRTYLFIERNGESGGYTYRKNGKLLPWVWKDVSTEVTFGYDSHILTAAEDESGWSIIEL
jgi:hypothetical protein